MSEQTNTYPTYSLSAADKADVVQADAFGRMVLRYQQQIKNLTVTNEELTRNLNTTQETLADRDRCCVELREQLAAADKANADQANAIDRLVICHQQQVKSLTDTNEELERDLNATQKTLCVCDRHRINLKEQLDVVMYRLNDAVQQILAAKQCQRDTNQMLDDFVQAEKDFEAKLCEAAQREEDLGNELRKADIRADCNSNDIKTLLRWNDKAEETIEQLTLHNSELKNTLAKFDVEHNARETALKCKIGRYVRDVVYLEAHVRELKEDLVNAEKHNDDLERLLEHRPSQAPQPNILEQCSLVRLKTILSADPTGISALIESHHGLTAAAAYMFAWNGMCSNPAQRADVRFVFVCALQDNKDFVDSVGRNWAVEFAEYFKVLI